MMDRVELSDLLVDMIPFLY